MAFGCGTVTITLHFKGLKFHSSKKAAEKEAHQMFVTRNVGRGENVAKAVKIKPF